MKTINSRPTFPKFSRHLFNYARPPVRINDRQVKGFIAYCKVSGFKERFLQVSKKDAMPEPVRQVVWEGRLVRGVPIPMILRNREKNH